MPGTDSLRLELGDFDFGVLLFGKLTLFNLFEIDFSETELWLSNINVELVGSMKSNDGITWQLLHKSDLKFESIDISTDNYFYNLLIDYSKDAINFATKICFAYVEVLLDQQVKQLNKLLAQGKELLMAVPSNLTLNMTTPFAPVLNPSSDLINMFFDGHFVGSQGLKDITDIPQRLESAHSQQFWIHESTINSYLHATSLFPVEFAFQRDSAQCNLKVDKSVTSNAISFSNQDGIILGNNDVFTGEVSCGAESLAEFDFKAKIVLNSSLHNMVVHSQVTSFDL